MKNKVNLPWECEPNYKQMAPNLTLMLSELNWPQWKAVTPKQSELVGLKVRESELVGLKVRECYIMYDNDKGSKQIELFLSLLKLHLFICLWHKI